MAEAPSVRSAYSELVGVLAKCFPSNCAHLKKLPKTQNIINDWQVLLNNPRIAARDVELFHSPPLSSLGLSRLYKEGKLTPKSQTNIWGFIDQVLEAMQPPVEVPDPHDLRMMQSILGGAGGLNLGNFANLIKGQLADNPELALMVNGLLESKGNFGSLLNKGGDDNPDAIPSEDGGDSGKRLGQVFQNLESNPQLQDAISNLRQTSDDGGGDSSKLIGGLVGALGGKPDADLAQKANHIFELIPDNLKEKLKTFGKDVSEKGGDPFANALSLLTTHFNAQDFQAVASAIVPNLADLVPKNVDS
jgi:hypothetical protein